jgi:hypothetical protein
MRILTYKRTHIGDPDKEGRFGIYNCMGRVRSFIFDAVIGVGGIGQEPKSYKIDRRINWVGINPKRKRRSGGNGAIITFETFLLLDEHGPLLETLAPNLANRMYNRGARILLNGCSDLERSEALGILKWSLNQTARNLITSEDKRGCKRRCQPLSKGRRTC